MEYKRGFVKLVKKGQKNFLYQPLTLCWPATWEIVWGISEKFTFDWPWGSRMLIWKHKENWILQKYSDVNSPLENFFVLLSIVVYVPQSLAQNRGRLDSPQIFPLHAKIYFSRATNSETSRRQNIFFHEVLLYFFLYFQMWQIPWFLWKLYGEHAVSCLYYYDDVFLFLFVFVLTLVPLQWEQGDSQCCLSTPPPCAHNTQSVRFILILAGISVASFSINFKHTWLT